MMNIALGFDKNFATYAATTIKSILLHNKNVTFYLMHDNLKKSDIKKIGDMIKEHNETCHWVDMSNEFNNLFTGSWKSKTLYFPLKLSSICDADRVLFLDADTFVTGDLSEFYSQNLDGFYLAAVNDYGMLSDLKTDNKLPLGNEKVDIKEYFSNIRKWNNTDMQRYFNSGMLLMNLDEMRKNNVQEKMLKSLEENIFAFPDQDCINFVCHDHVKIIEPKYNFMVLFKSTWNRLDDEQKARLIPYKEEHKRPLIIHYLLKPWRRPQDNLPFSKEYKKVKSLTPYKNVLSRQEIFQCRLSKTGTYLRLFNKTIFEF